MPEIKHTFTAGKMDKDLDERLVRNGEYRDAMNVQVRTTSGDSDGVGDAGVVQNIQGNSQVGTSMGDDLVAGFLDADFVCVGSIADEKSDNAYFLFTNAHSTAPIKIDTIVQQNIITGQTTPVVVDKWQVTTTTASIGWTASSALNGSTPYNTLPTSTVAATTTTPQISISDLRVNMKIIVDITGGQNFKGKIKSISGTTITLYDYSSFNLTTADSITTFTHDRVLNFNQDVRINGINIIDDLLLFTDGIHEPKKINITRSIAGTNILGNTHTNLMVLDTTGDLVEAATLELNGVISDLLEEHVTVLRPAPKTPPTLDIKTRDVGELQFTTPNQIWTVDGAIPNVGDNIFLGLDSNDVSQTSPDLIETTFIANDILNVSQENIIEGEPVIYFKVKFITYITTDGNDDAVLTPTSKIQVQIISELPEIGSVDNEWLLQIELDKPKFELKFARFGYRYKYEDGEYSAFSPWSELAFDPGVFDYDSTKGYNLGMVNTIQNLVIKDFIPHYEERALDIVGVDILYKSTDSANVYTIKSIKKETDPEWELFTPNNSDPDSMETGRLEITTESIHRVLPSNQILRTFDNVPRYAKAQEITGSRVVYGNYTQGFDLTFPVGLKQFLASEEVGDQPKKSVKSIRDYKVGMVFGDKYGRETPVIASTNVLGQPGSYVSTTGDISVERSFCAHANKLSVLQQWQNPLGSSVPSSMEWMDYVKYYVKETSNEYYNLVLDRWYYARNQENIWLSFPSADRNKVDIETYLLLKKAHGKDEAVLDKARYKIIAIENEAPDFIKIDHREMGLIPLTHTPGDFSSIFTDDSQDPNINEPNKLTNPDTTSIEIKEQEWGDFLETYGDNLRGTLKVRIVGRTMTTSTSPVQVNRINSGNFVTVTHHRTDSFGNCTISFKESFGASANMLVAFNNAGYTVNDSANDLQYFLEFEEEVVENKPEFDGRFFALIEKDISVEKHVEEFIGSGVAFIEKKLYKIAYVDTQQFNPAESGKYSTGANTGTVVNAPTFAPNLVDTGPPSEWWGWGTFNNSIEANLFALGCRATSTSDNINYGTNTLNYWQDFKDWHSNENDYNGAEEAGFTAQGRVFLDGARANEFQLNEFGADGMTPQGQPHIGTNGGTVAVNDADDTGDTTPSYWGGISIYNYKPTALDQGSAENGLGRMVLSQQSKNNQDGNGGWDSAGGDATELYDAFTTEGTYFQFKNDTTNTSDPNFPNGKPHVYQTVHRHVPDPTIFLPVEVTQEVFNYGAGGLNTDQPINTNALSTDATYADSLFPNDGFPNFGTFGGANLDLWEAVQADTTGVGIVGSDLSPAFNYGSPGGKAVINVGVLDPSGSTGEYDQYKQQRRCGRCDKDTARCNRHSIRFEFRKIDPETGELTNDGITDLDLFDPRGEAKHDGTIGSIEIQIMERKTTLSSVIVHESDRSVWETEPKEDVGLDIYYEATHAIPMKLRKGNTLAFAPLKSKVNAIRRGTNGWLGVDLQSYSFDGNAFTDTIVGGAEYTTNESLIKVVNTDSNDAIVNNTHGLGINDYITFTHSSGLRTRSEIKGYYALSNGTYQLQTPTAVTITYDPAVLLDPNTNDNTVTLSSTSGFSTGVNIVFDAGQGNASNVSGVFGKNLGTSIQLTDTSFFDQTGESDLTATFVMPTGFYQIDKDVYQYEVDLGWHNCYSFGNGVESDRIRDDFNAPTIDNGIKVSTTFIDYGQEDKTSSLIYSGLYNTTSGVNDLNEFNMGEKISKNINPAYGPIQALKSRDTDLVTLCEDRILKILANKEAVFNADGNPQLVATDRVLGQVTSFKGNYGISKNPESLASDQYRMYFTDTQRGAVLRLSMDGITPISNVGMKSYFRNTLRGATDLLGGFDIVNGEYNLTINKTTTVSFNEGSKGWVSFKSFIPQESASVSGTYLTINNSGIFKHYVDTFDDNNVVNNRNIFYNKFVNGVSDDPAESTITVMFNDQPGSVKSFKTINYEGSQARVDQYLDANGNPSGDDGEYYNIFADKKGWWVGSFQTDLQTGKVYWFIDKENKWFNNICGTETTLDNLDTAEFTVQGIGTQVADPVLPEPPPSTFTLTIQND